MEYGPVFIHPSATVESIAEAHPSWARSMDECRPWQRSGAGWLAQTPAPAPVHVFDQCTSTMDVAWDMLARNELEQWHCVLAVSQTGGRGQLRRPWESPPGNLYASFLLPEPTEGREQWARMLPVLMGVLLAEALEELGVRAVLKWPNDLVVRGKKGGGMLLEDRGGRTMLGLGLNLAAAPPKERLRKDFALEAGVVFAENGTPSILSVCCALVNYTKKRYETLLNGSLPTDFIPCAEQRLAWMGREILVQEGSGAAYAARIRGLTTAGGLVVTHEGKESVLFSGSILPM